MILSDVTLREGEQQSGTSYTATQKIKAGKQIDQLGLDYIQPGFPATGSKDQQVISTLSEEVSANVVGLARAKPADIEAVAVAEADAVDIIVPASDAHVDHMIGKPRENIHKMTEEAISLARSHGLEVHLSLTDAFRTEPDVLVEGFDRYSNVAYITLADSAGARVPPSITQVLETVTDSVDPSRIGVHFHDDLGVGTSNTLAAIAAGVEKIDASIASVGERAGNAALEEIIVAGTTDQEITFDVDLPKLIPVCQSVLDLLGESVSDNKPVLGSRVFEHESGLHTAAMLSDPASFEPFDPTRFGGERQLVFGVQTGHGAAKMLLEEASVTVSDNHCQQLLTLLEKNGPIDKDEALRLIHSYISSQ